MKRLGAVKTFAFGALLIPAVVMASVVIGHPVEVRVAGGTGLTNNFGELPVRDAIYDRCDGTTTTVEVNTVLDVIAGDTLTLPEGSICGISLDLGGRVHVGGAGTSGGTYSLSLATGYVDIDVDPPLVVSGGTSAALGIRLASPNWITATSLGLSSGSHVHVSPGHALHNGLRDAIRFDSELLQ